jgi:hypothetical protein
MWRKPVGEGAKRVTMESVIERGRQVKGAVVYNRIGA